MNLNISRFFKSNSKSKNTYEISNNKYNFLKSLTQFLKNLKTNEEATVESSGSPHYTPRTSFQEGSNNNASTNLLPLAQIVEEVRNSYEASHHKNETSALTDPPKPYYSFGAGSL